MVQGLRHMRTGHRLMVLSNPGTQHMLLSAGIAQEPVSMTSRLVAETSSVCSHTAPESVSTRSLRGGE